MLKENEPIKNEQRFLIDKSSLIPIKYTDYNIMNIEMNIYEVKLQEVYKECTIDMSS